MKNIIRSKLYQDSFGPCQKDNNFAINQCSDKNKKFKEAGTKIDNQIK